MIFFFSAQPDLNSGLGTLDLVLRKIVHMAEYGVLWFLWWRALNREHAGIAAAITVIYAASDEWHQTFVHGRVGAPTDVLIDACGVLLAFLISRLRQRQVDSS